jgi:hypothetical protein
MACNDDGDYDEFNPRLSYNENVKMDTPVNIKLEGSVKFLPEVSSNKVSKSKSTSSPNFRVNKKEKSPTKVVKQPRKPTLKKK